jgi:polyketide cyclase/dehydrase/lipid transport protein
MSSWRQQALIEAPVEAVWGMVGDPTRYPEWAENVVEVTGLPTVAPQATYRQVSRGPLGAGTVTTTFIVDELDELREIRLRCLTSGYYCHWQLTPAREDTFADVEVGMEPEALRYRAMDRVIGKRWYRGIVDEYLDRLKTRLARDGAGERS